jgi:hypothetical protein
VRKTASEHEDETPSDINSKFNAPWMGGKMEARDEDEEVVFRFQKVELSQETCYFLYSSFL